MARSALADISSRRASVSIRARTETLSFAAADQSRQSTLADSCAESIAAGVQLGQSPESIGRARQLPAVEIVRRLPEHRIVNVELPLAVAQEDRAELGVGGRSPGDPLEQGERGASGIVIDSE